MATLSPVVVSNAELKNKLKTQTFCCLEKFALTVHSFNSIEAECIIKGYAEYDPDCRCDVKLSLCIIREYKAM